MRPGYLLLSAFVALVVAAPGPSLGEALTYFDATNSLIDISNPVGTAWHQLYPNYCLAPFTITGWKDNGDGVLSYCDTLSMTDPGGLPQCHHVVDVTITLELTPITVPDGFPHYWDWNHSAGGEPLTMPICTWWEEIYPDLGLEFHIAGWIDNGSGQLDSCDVVINDAGAQYHVEGVHTDLVTEPADECAAEIDTWGRIKALYR